jgi:hypothetical protein
MFMRLLSSVFRQRRIKKTAATVESMERMVGLVARVKPALGSEMPNNDSAQEKRYLDLRFGELYGEYVGQGHDRVKASRERLHRVGGRLRRRP